MSDREPIRIRCEGSMQPLAGGVICAMCGALVTVESNGTATVHLRNDVLAMLERGDFG